MTLPALLNHFCALPPSLQQHVLLTFMRHSSLPVLRTLHSVLTPTLARDFLTLLPRELVSHVLSFLPFSTLVRASRVSKTWRSIIDSDPILWQDLMKSARIWLRGERKQRRVGLLLQGTLRISLSYTYFMVEQSFRTRRLLEQVSAAEETSADNSIHVYSSFARRFIRRRVGACCYKGYQLHPAKQLYIRLWRAHQRTSG